MNTHASYAYTNANIYVREYVCVCLHTSISKLPCVYLFYPFLVYHCIYICGQCDLEPHCQLYAHNKSTSSLQSLRVDTFLELGPVRDKN